MKVFGRLLLVALIACCLGGRILAMDGSSLRFAHFAASEGKLDVYVGGARVVEGLEFQSASAYQPVSGMMAEVLLVPAGEAMDKALTPKPLMLMLPDGVAGYFTAAIVGSAGDGSLALVLLPQDGVVGSNAPVGEATNGNIKVSGAYARPTTMDMAMDMNMGAEATPEASMGGMDMGGTATPEAAMGGMDMGSDRVTGVFMLIENIGDKSEVLVGAKSDISDEVQVHQTVVDASGMAQMNEVPSIEIPAGGKVELAHGGYHIMANNLTRDLRPGDTFNLTLVFESGLEISVVVPVKMMP